MSEFDHHKLNELGFLISQSIAGSITREDLHRIEDILESSPQMRAYYREYLSVYCDLTSLLGGAQFNPLEVSGADDNEFWKAMAEYEKTAPAIEIPQEKLQRELIEPIERPVLRTKKKLDKWGVAALFTAAAAMVFLVLFVHFAPSKVGIEVATLTDSINAAWADMEDAALSNGTRLATGRTSYFLKEGMAQLLFDNDAQVTLEGPIEFQILTEDQIQLNYGRLYATVPQGAIGFTVQTLIARIIDLGTEFGVEALADGDTDLYQIKGRTMLIAGEKSNKVSLEVGSGIAKRASASASTVSDIPCRKEVFVRKINSAQNAVWRGKNLDVVNLVAGGNGLVEGTYFKRIDPLTGIYSSEEQFSVAPPRSVSNDFKPVSSSGVVDGVGVPSGQTLITTEGKSFNFAETSKTITWDIIAFNNGRDEFGKEAAPVFHHGQKYGSKDSPALLLHSNVLITLDLQKIRNILPENTIKRFKGWGGISEAVIGKPDPAKVDFFLLIDGELRYEKTDLTVADGVIDIDIPLHPGDRFITFVVTEGNEDPKAWYIPLSNDFFYLINPEFVL